MNEIENKTKTCYQCKEIKTINEFTFNKKGKDGLSIYCKQCTRKTNSEKYYRLYRPKQLKRMKRKTPKTGDKFGRISIIEEPYICQDECRDKGHLVVKCRCDCQRVVIRRCEYLTHKRRLAKSCGKCSGQKYFVKKGDIFNSLTIMSDPFVGVHGKSTYSEITVRCECLNVFNIRLSILFAKKKACCNKCSKKKLSKRQTRHGLSNTRIYKIWSGMIRRCYNPKCWCYENYGGKGIKICDEWKNDVTKFYDWAMANGYEDNLTIDRIDPDKDYEPSNGQWITAQENSKKKKSDRQLQINKFTSRIRELEEENQKLKTKLLKCNEFHQIPQTV